MNTKLIKNIIFWLLAITVFLIPFLRWEGLFFASISTKTFFFRTLIEIIFVLWLPVLLLDKSFRPKFSRILLALSAFLGVMFISAIFGADFYKSLWSDYERMIGFWTHLHLFVFFLMLVSLLRTKKDWDWFFNISLVSAVLVALYGWLEAFGVVAGFPDKIEGTIGNSIFLASYLLFFAFLSLWFLFKQKDWNYKVFYYLFSALIIAGAIVFTSARGSMLGLAVGFWVLLLIIALFIPREGQMLSVSYKKLKKAVLGLIILGVLVSVMFFVFRGRFADSSFGPLERIASASFAEKTIQGRILTWGVAWEGWKEHFILGWGIENFNLLFNKHYDPRLVGHEPWFDRAHNFIFDIGTTVGILGLLAYLSVFIFLFQLLFKKRKEYFLTTVAFCGFFIAYLVNNLFAFDMLMSLIPFYIALAYVYFLEADFEEPVFERINPLRNSEGAQHKISNGINIKKFALFCFVAGLIILPAFYYINWRPLRENMLGRQAFARLVEGRDREAIELFEKGLEYNTFGNIDLRRFAAEYVFEFLQKGGERNSQAMQALLEYTAQKLEENILERPKDVKWYMFSGELYNLLAADNPKYAKKAEEKFLKAIELSPNRQQSYMEVAQARLVGGDVKGALAMLDKTLELFPSYVPAHVQSFSYAIKLGIKEREEKEENWIKENSQVIGDEYIINIIETYFEAERFEKAAFYQKELINMVESRKASKLKITSQYARLAALYEKAGQIDKAIETVLYIIEYNPAWAQKNNAEAYLNYLSNLQ